ncbi:hypothetical protein WICPIJ_007080 [Wickerhamomyces pijperi]|uniref:Uncharacterized protein n=1 Tax=Wickerhamomyces pijperi TaxID=599730 RepID=A0A9P8TKA4_WICPI|nr:hypothetical protein WICPIJ_007080 [Wickerhamomyces pijperi]
MKGAKLKPKTTTTIAPNLNKLTHLTARDTLPVFNDSQSRHSLLNKYTNTAGAKYKLICLKQSNTEKVKASQYD